MPDVTFGREGGVKLSNLPTRCLRPPPVVLESALGAPNWHLAPLSMGWEGLSDQAPCRALKDTRKNGGKSLDALVHHMTDDALVQWAWSPGARVPPPLAQADSHRVVRRWAETGASCPAG